MKPALARFLFILMPVLMFAGCAEKQILPYGRDIGSGTKYYKVQKGDTLYSIGFRSGHGYKRLAAWNKLAPPYTVRVGQSIKLFKSKVPYTAPYKTSKQKKYPPKNKKNKQKSTDISINNKTVLKLYWQWPIKGKIVKKFSSTGNKGIDIYGKTGLPVRSAAAGKVVYSGHGLIGYGNLLIIKHSEEYLSAYGNNRKLLVKEGRRVKKGQVIAEVGKKSYLHFEIRKNGKSVNPIYYLPKIK